MNYFQSSTTPENNAPGGMTGGFGGAQAASTNPFLSKFIKGSNILIDASQNLSTGKAVFETSNLFGTPGRNKQAANNDDDGGDPLFSMNSGGRRGKK